MIAYQHVQVDEFHFAFLMDIRPQHQACDYNRFIYMNVVSRNPVRFLLAAFQCSCPLYQWTDVNVGRTSQALRDTPVTTLIAMAVHIPQFVRP